MKACESCTRRVEIGAHHKKMSPSRRLLGLVFVYLPILTLPFVITSAYLTYYHLLMVGAKDVRTWADFMPDRATHRYDLKNQIVMQSDAKASLSHSKLYWILNCTWYCPLSVALFDWHSLFSESRGKLVVSFTHDRKQSGEYDVGAIDQSFWHIYPEECAKLHEDDLNNPLWNKEKEE